VPQEINSKRQADKRASDLQHLPPAFNSIAPQSRKFVERLVKAVVAVCRLSLRESTPFRGAKGDNQEK
jgi:hypothetical protein